MSSKIKFIFFDMGKVLLEFNHQRLVDQVSKLSGMPNTEINQILFHPPYDLENRFERGELDEQEFHSAFCEVAKCDVGKEDLMLAVADIFWLNTPIVHLITQLKCLDFPIAVLSNTCSAHWDFVQQRFAVVGKLFDHSVLSYEEQSMKPDVKIYQAAIAMAKELAGCESKEIFFTDDKQENVDAARKAGMQSELFVTAQTLGKQLAAGGVPISG